MVCRFNTLYCLKVIALQNMAIYFWTIKSAIMDTQNDNNDFNASRTRGRIFAGLFLLLVGGAFLMREMDFPFFPDWLFTWPMILIAVGIYSGIKHQFRNPGWLIMILVGGIFLADEVNLGFDLHRFIVPIVIIAVGLMMLLRPSRMFRNRRWNYFGGWDRNNWSNAQTPSGMNTAASSQGTHGAEFSSQDFFDSTSVFGGVKKVIVSKDFRGGDITCFMGGCEVDLTQADMTNPAVVDVTQVFGGTKLIVPSHWQVRTEMTAIFGSVEDKRQLPLSSDSGKVLVLKGTSLFGGIEIKNY